MSRIQIAERRVGDVIILTLNGRLVLDEGDAPFRERIDALILAGRYEVIVNLHDVNYIDSCGVGVLVSKFLSLRRRGGDLKLVCLSERCHHVLGITGLLPIFAPLDSEDAALQSFAVKA
jgi:anti-sigma B factor antagonist